jgi:hypothetical protein
LNSPGKVTKVSILVNVTLVCGDRHIEAHKKKGQTMNSSGKRKLPTEVKSKEVKIKRIDMKEKVKKVLTKAELVLELKSVKEAYEALKETNTENLKTIANLKGDLKTLGKETISTHTQTDFNCNECNFQGSSHLELDWHVKNHHGWASDTHTGSEDFLENENNAKQNSCIQCNLCDDGFEFKSQLMEHRKKNHTKGGQIQKDDGCSVIVCNLCEENFDTRRSLMIHKKKEHTEKVALCWNFSAGNCELGDDLCWFSHKNPSDGNKSLNCKMCGENFNSKNDLHCHMKHGHTMSVPLCKNASKNTCWYGAENCWFRHEQTEKIIINESQEITAKIFDMMETFSKRIIQIEN